MRNQDFVFLYTVVIQMSLNSKKKNHDRWYCQYQRNPVSWKCFSSVSEKSMKNTLISTPNSTFQLGVICLIKKIWHFSIISLSDSDFFQAWHFRFWHFPILQGKKTAADRNEKKVNRTVDQFIKERILGYTYVYTCTTGMRSATSASITVFTKRPDRPSHNIRRLAEFI